jgi:hypothetical protein
LNHLVTVRSIVGMMCALCVVKFFPAVDCIADTSLWPDDTLMLILGHSVSWLILFRSCKPNCFQLRVCLVRFLALTFVP